MSDCIGQQFGDYRLIRFLGGGASGDVYIGKHIYHQTIVAVKVLKTQITPEQLKDFINEVRTFRLKHPNIIQLLDFGIAKGNIPFLIMDYAPNGSLRQRHPVGTRLPLNLVINYARQVGTALQYAHEHRLIHRDVKPENMLIGANNEVLLSDFGIATVAHRTTSQETQEVAGTALYMAPEQFRGKPHLASDQYALGVVIYEWLCGERPFRGSFAELYSQHLFEPPPPLHTKIPAIPFMIEQVVLRALAKEPQQRFAQVQDFVDALRDASQPTEPGRLTYPKPAVAVSSPSSRDISAFYPQAPSPILSVPSSASLKMNTTLSSPQALSSVPRTTTSPPLTVYTPSSYSQTPIPPSTPHFQKDQKAVAMVHSEGVVPRNADKRTQSGMKTMLLIGLLFLIIGGSLGFFFSSLLPRPTSPQGTTSTYSTNIPDSTNNSLSLVNSNTAMFGFDLQHSRFNPDEHTLNSTNVSHLKPYWMVPIGIAIIPNSANIDSSPVVANGIVYVGSWDGNLYAFNAATGAVIWKAPTGDFIRSSPAIANGLVYVGSWDGKLYAFDARTGGLRWSTPTGRSISSSPAVADGVVYVGSWDGKLYAFDAAIGKILWTYTTGGAIPSSSPAIANGVVYIGSFDKKLYAIDGKTGKKLWNASTGETIASSPAIANGIVYVGSSDDKLYAFDAGTGSPRWSTPTGDPITSSPAIVDGVVYVSSWDNKLYAFDAKKGINLWTYTTHDKILSSPIVANGVVYIGSQDHSLYAIGTQTKNFLWSFDTGDVIDSSPTVANGVVYINVGNGKLYAFHLPD